MQSLAGLFPVSGSSFVGIAPSYTYRCATYHTVISRADSFCCEHGAPWLFLRARARRRQFCSPASVLPLNQLYMWVVLVCVPGLVYTYYTYMRLIGFAWAAVAGAVQWGGIGVASWRRLSHPCLTACCSLLQLGWRLPFHTPTPHGP